MTVIDKLNKDGSGRIIIDAQKDLKITLKSKYAKTAVRCDQGHCAFAEAAKDQFPALVEVKFDKTITRFCYPEHVVRYGNSAAMERQITKFDKTGTFDDGDYWLLAIPPSQELGARHSPSLPTADRGTRGKRETSIKFDGDIRPSTWTFKGVEKKTRRKARAAR